MQLFLKQHGWKLCHLKVRRFWHPTVAINLRSCVWFLPPERFIFIDDPHALNGRFLRSWICQLHDMDDRSGILPAVIRWRWHLRPPGPQRLSYLKLEHAKELCKQNQTWLNLNHKHVALQRSCHCPHCWRSLNHWCFGALRFWSARWSDRKRW